MWGAILRILYWCEPGPSGVIIYLPVTDVTATEADGLPKAERDLAGANVYFYLAVFKNKK